LKSKLFDRYGKLLTLKQGILSLGIPEDQRWRAKDPNEVTKAVWVKLGSGGNGARPESD
jgi:hypothetical protein